MEHSFIQRMVTVLQAGFFRQSSQGVTLFAFLSSLPDFTEDYITNRVQTIFLNGDPVDDMNLAFSSETATLALSAAMPGLVGSLFRKSTILTSLRKTAVQKQVRDDGAPVVVRVKFFNIISVEKGAALLSGGAALRSEDLLSFLELRPSLVNAMRHISFDQRQISTHDLLPELKRQRKLNFICNPADV